MANAETPARLRWREERAARLGGEIYLQDVGAQVSVFPVVP